MNIVFDFGAVLFTWQPGQFLMQTFPQLVDTPEKAAHLAHQVFGHADWHSFDRGVLGVDEVTARTCERLELPLPEMRQLVLGIGERLIPIQGTVALLRQLHARRLEGEGITGLYYLSNMPESYARVLEDRHEFLQWFDGGIFSCDVRVIKPDPVIYQLLQSRYALKPASTLFIDDLKSNVNVALALGWHGIHFESPHQLQAELALSGL